MIDLAALRTQAHDAVLDGLRQGSSLRDIEAAVGRSAVRGRSAPDLAMFELAIAALDVAEVTRDRPLDVSGWRERFLPELVFKNRQDEVARLVYAFQTALAFRTGVRPDVLDDTYGWGSKEVWPYAVRAAVMTIRAVADGGDLAKTCTQVQAALQPIDGA